MPSACARCHTRKIKCDAAKPLCGPCRDAREICQPHERRRRRGLPTSADDSGARLKWLEEELQRHVPINIQQICTGSDLSHFLNHEEGTHPVAATESSSGEVPEGSTLPGRSSNFSTSPQKSSEVTPDISLLTLNATGEMRYLGPSGGAYFAQYAANLTRASISRDKPQFTAAPARLGSSTQTERASSSRPPHTEDVSITLTPMMAKYLLSCYFYWVHPLIPIIDQPFRENVLDRLADLQQHDGSHLMGHEPLFLVIYYLVLALGAIHSDSGTGSDHDFTANLAFKNAVLNGLISPESIYIKAMDTLDFVSPHLHPSIPMIQVLLLICTFGGYRPSGNRHWQLSGMAIKMVIEIGLHRHRDAWMFDKAQLDLRQRVFWATYAVEITVAFNLGRPPGISDEHIDAEFPSDEPDTRLMLFHVRHRQIQSSMLKEVYCAPGKVQSLTDDQRSAVIEKIQAQLDSWRDSIDDIYGGSNSPYPQQYWSRLYYSTTSALHRPSPLFPKPTIGSKGLCLNGAGNFIDICHHLFKTSQVPLSWMLLQGTLLAIITLLVTAKIDASALLRAGTTSIAAIMEWNRKCSVILAIISERWPQSFIQNLETQINVLATDTIQELLRCQAIVEREPHHTAVNDIPDISLSEGASGTDRIPSDVNVIDTASILPIGVWEEQNQFSSAPNQRVNQEGDFTSIYNNYNGFNHSMINDIFSLEGLFGEEDSFEYNGFSTLGRF